MSMKVAQLPKTWLIHSVDYLHEGGKDRWGEVKYEETTVNYVRVEPTKSYAVNERQEGITYSLVVFVDGVHSSHTAFAEGNKIRFEGNEYERSSFRCR